MRRRILVISCNTAMPEATAPMHALAGVPDLMRRFDAVYDYNTCIEPQHPSTWHPRVGDLPLWERHFRQLWGLGSSDLHLVVESIQVNPAQALCRIFGDARIDVYADGLMSYGPTRAPLPEMVVSRIERLLHLDLAPGITPLLLSERQVPRMIIPAESFRTVVKTMVAEPAASDADDGRTVLIIGQYLAAAGCLSEREELDLYAAMVTSCADAGYSRLAFKPHPSALDTQRLSLETVADARGVQLLVADQDEIAEAWFERGGVELVVGCFSTALMTAANLYGLPVAHQSGNVSCRPLPEPPALLQTSAADPTRLARQPSSTVATATDFPTAFPPTNTTCPDDSGPVAAGRCSDCAKFRQRSWQGCHSIAENPAKIAIYGAAQKMTKALPVGPSRRPHARTIQVLPNRLRLPVGLYPARFSPCDRLPPGSLQMQLDAVR
jgi:hypothetical protein